jgi:hypothetical protein
VVIDLDRAVYHRAAGSRAGCARNLRASSRSVVKNGLWPERVGRRELATFMAAYTAGDRPLRAELRGFIRGEQVKLALHRLRYRFIRPAAPLGAASPLRRA